jgi:hypothetical protein
MAIVDVPDALFLLRKLTTINVRRALLLCVCSHRKNGLVFQQLNDNLFTEFPSALLNATHLHSVSVRVVSSTKSSRLALTVVLLVPFSSPIVASPQICHLTIANLRALHSLTVRTRSFPGILDGFPC